MMNINLAGRITREVKARTIKTGKGDLKVANGVLAVKRSYYNKEKGEKETTFINIQAWGSRAELLEKYTTQGSLIQLAGDLVNNNYTDKNGIKRYEMLFEVSDIEFLETKEMTEQRATHNIMNQLPPEQASSLQNTEPPAYQ
jgi:single-strand DNA-binding protein